MRAQKISKRPMDGLRIALGSVLAAGALGATAAKAQIDDAKFPATASLRIQACMIEGLKAFDPQTKMTIADVKSDSFYQGGSEIREGIGQPDKYGNWPGNIHIDVNNSDGKINEIGIREMVMNDAGETVDGLWRTSALDQGYYKLKDAGNAVRVAYKGCLARRGPN